MTGKHGIEIFTSGAVTIDLAGYELHGADAGRHAIYAVSAAGVSVRNGAIRDWTQSGLLLDTGGLGPARIESLIIAGNNGYGATLSPGAIVRNCTFVGNGLAGLKTGSDADVEGCVARGNGAGFDLGSQAVIRECSAANNNGYGFILASDGTAERCKATYNGTSSGGGFRTNGDRNMLSDNHATMNRLGFSIGGSKNMVVRNVAMDNLNNEFVIGGGNFVAPQAAGASVSGVTNPLANLTD